ncbi:hypothetical protein FKP32DRAFT_986590 [Trametes sanguinea]|nr:hypothetical protein FKP32DRAFT_986590 [Trametes sanguinea]
MDLYPIYRTGYLINREACRRHLGEGCAFPHLDPPPPDNLTDIPVPSESELIAQSYSESCAIPRRRESGPLPIRLSKSHPAKPLRIDYVPGGLGRTVTTLEKLRNIQAKGLKRCFEAIDRMRPHEDDKSQYMALHDATVIPMLNILLVEAASVQCPTWPSTACNGERAWHR